MKRAVPTIVPLTKWVEHLIARRERAGLGAEIPAIDPADAGTEARVLLLMEAPGPMANARNARPGSGFISSDTTAESLWLARRAAGLVDNALLWNVVPWYLGPANKKPKVQDLREGAEPVRELIAMVPELHTVVTLGLFARRGWARFGRPNIGISVRTIDTWHPSAQSMIQPGKRDHLISALTRASRDWRSDGAEDREIMVDRDRAGNPVAHWYVNADRDRVEVHPRWW